MHIDTVLRRFEDWVTNNYDLKKPKIAEEYRYFHTVLDISTFLAKGNHFSKEDLFITQVIAIVHHCSMFRQHTYSRVYDRHAKSGSRLLEKDLLNLILPESREYDLIIIYSTSFHHASHLDYTAPQRAWRHWELLRLAIKISAFDKYIHNLEKNISPNCSTNLSLSPQVRELLEKAEPIPVSILQSELDRLAFQFGKISKITSEVALKCIKQQDYVNRLTNLFLERFPLCDKNEINFVRQMAIKFLQ